MGRKKNPKRELILREIKKYKRRASTRRNLYPFLAEKYEVSRAYVRLVASRAKLTSREHSLMCVFSEEEEDALVKVCIAYSRRNEAFTIPDFITIASFFKGITEKCDFFSRSFVRTFRGRHSDLLKIQKGKITSPTRNAENMLELTQEFISGLNSSMVSHTINKNNLFVFDETIVGDSISLPLVIGERRKSGGGNLNVVYTREKALCSYIPFSMPDGTTPFRVYIFKVEKMKKDQEILHVVVPKNEFGLRSQPHRFFFGQ